MNISFKCIDCTIRKADSILEQYEPDKLKREKLRVKVMDIISKSKPEDTSPYLSSKVMRLLDEELNLGDIYYAVKKEYNSLLMSMENEMLKVIYGSADKLLTALKYAMIGNYIDFASLDNVELDKLKELIKNAPFEKIIEKEYEKFSGDLKTADKLTYITDNAGEIVFDKIFMKIMKEVNPALKLEVIVRGKPIHNDATAADAQETGIDKIARVITSGTDIPGTLLTEISMEAMKSINSSEIIISKGQGNFETLYESGKNIYYIFLCKCELFIKRFHTGEFEGIFANEKSIPYMIK